MLILPMQYKLSWKQPPYLTLVLILINCLIFFIYQSQDHEKLVSISEAYKNSGLLYTEAPHYSGYLSRKMLSDKSISPEVIQKIDESVEKKQFNQIQHQMMLDQNFVQYLEESSSMIWDANDGQWWRDTRLAFYESELKKISSVAYGYKPGDFEVSNLISYQFMHGNLGHLLGNMVILFILAFGLERMTSRAKILLVYLLSGICGAMVFGLTNPSNLSPLVGASGAISGLMGVYAGMFALQKIRFFYFIFFAFGYLRLPALVLLPIWVANELFQFFQNPESAVAYFAHIGGLVCGGIIGWGFKNSWLKAREDDIAIEEQSEALFRKQYAQALKSVEQLKFQSARHQFSALWSKHPDKVFLLEHLFHLYKMQPKNKQFHLIFSQWLQNQETPYSEAFWQCAVEYMAEPKHLLLLNAEQREALIRAAIETDQVTLLEKLLDVLEAQYRKDNEPQTVSKVLEHLKQYYMHTAQATKSQHFDQKLQSLFSA